MHVTLIGTGCSAEQLTDEGRRAVEDAELIIGAQRMLSVLPTHSAETAALYQPQQICELLLEHRPERACVVFSGDSGFYSGARKLLPLLKENGIETKVFPGVSSLQTLSARLGIPWQDWKLCSAHGVSCDPLAEIMSGRPCFFLTGGTITPQSICRELTAAGLGALSVRAGENLGCANEKITAGTAAEFSETEFSALSVLLTDAAPMFPKTAPGIPDETFIRGKVPMTKREVRAVIPSMLRLRPGDICWDIGAGTGSVSIELALHSRGVWAMERRPEAVELIRLNREKFCAWNLQILTAEAPAGMDRLPSPDAVFIGGSGGHLESVLDSVFAANPKARVCISAIALETLSCAAQALSGHGCTVEVTQLAVSRTKPAGELHLLTAQNPVFLIAGSIQ